MRSKRSGAGFRRSLMSRYLLIVLLALLFIPVMFALASLALVISAPVTRSLDTNTSQYGSAADLESAWHQEAAMLANQSADQINQRLKELKEKYPDASLFWVDGDGGTRLQLPQQAGLPLHWTASSAIRFMKESVNRDPFTVIALLGKDDSAKAFMVLQIPRSLLRHTAPLGYSTTYLIGFMVLMFVLFILLSWLFFRQIRVRLLGLQSAMALPADNSLPLPIVQHKEDEIGQLEGAFNEMVVQLRASRQREREEEELRKRLISNLSHDLRTPLTIISSQIYSLRRDVPGQSAQKALSQIEGKIGDMGSQIENLLSYTLMASGRYTLQTERQDVLRLVRESAAAWYPHWEKEGIDADVRLPEQPLIWNVDKEAFRRVLDNLFQNVVRHTGGGAYIGIYTEEHEGTLALVIADRGEGMDMDSPGKGAGIGLAIVDYLLREMGLCRQTAGSVEGTRVYIYPRAMDSNF